MKNIDKWIFIPIVIVVVIVVVLLSSNVRASAAGYEQPDLGRTGSVTVALHSLEDGLDPADGELTLYRAADLQEMDGHLIYQVTDLFQGCGILPETWSDMTEGSWSELAQGLASWLEEQDLPDETDGPSGMVQTAAVGPDGAAAFPDLSLGLYLIVQTESSSGYYDIDPFVVTVPMETDGQWQYDVDASPKTEIVPLPTAGPVIGGAEPPEETMMPDPTDDPEDPDDPAPEETIMPDQTADPEDTESPDLGETEAPVQTWEPSPAPVSGNEATASPSPSPAAAGEDSPETLPQTGLILWPVLVLAIAGTGLVAAGILLRRRS